MEQTTFRIFIFGTLKSDYPNFRFNSGTRMSGLFTTVEKYPLYLIGPRHSPWMINDPGVGFEVEGEVFEVDAKGLKVMDELERIDRENGYRRLIIAIQSKNSGEVLDAYVYLKTKKQYLEERHAKNVCSGPWDCYTVEQSRRYRPRNHSDQG